MASLILTMTLATAGKYFLEFLPVPETFLQFLNFIISFCVLATLFASMFKWLPDKKIFWSDVWIGALVTSLLFNVGKSVIGFYIGKQSFTSTYGAIGGVLALLVWIYYSAQIVYLVLNLPKCIRGTMARKRIDRPNRLFN